MEYKELKNKAEKELQKYLQESLDKLRELRFKVASNQLKNVREIRVLRQNIARCKYLLSQKRGTAVNEPAEK